MNNQSELLSDIQPDQDNLYQETPIYKEAVSHFRATHYYYIFYGLIKIVCGITLLYYNHTFFDLNYWIVAIILHALIMIMVHMNHLKYLKMNKRNLAYKLDQIAVMPQAEPIIDQRRLQILSRQIKLEIIKLTIFGKWTCRIIGIVYQLLVGYGVYLFCIYYNHKTEDIVYQYYFVVAVLIHSLYQYIDFYLIAFLAVLGSPFLVIFACYYCANLCTKEQQRNDARARLQGIKYKPNLIEGDPECTICRCPYELNEKVVVLKCSKLHHYHESCIMSWINLNNTCPLCRKSI